jgi:PIN domain nuclease of toxin-antitoxin system
MNLLLDTHALLWWQTNDERLSNRARALIADEMNEVFVSAASAWEIATKQRLGKLDEVPDAASRFAELVAADGFEHLPITYMHSLRAGGYQIAHRDPFDRILAAQSELEHLLLVTCDSAFELFACKTVW